jgi:Mor family transcriptional regulator
MNAKPTAAQIREGRNRNIRYAHADGLGAQWLANVYHLSLSTIYRIVNTPNK